MGKKDDNRGWTVQKRSGFFGFGTSVQSFEDWAREKGYSASDIAKAKKLGKKLGGRAPNA